MGDAIDADGLIVASHALSEEVAAMRKAVKRGPLEFEALCDVLGLSPSKTREVMAAADEMHVAFQVDGDRVGLGMPSSADTIEHVEVLPTTGPERVVGVISDLHLGSRYCMRNQLQEFIHHAYEAGARVILCPGDWLDGNYKHGQFELTHVSIDDQCEDANETLPQLPGLLYVGITGNHDETFWRDTGLNVGRYIEHYFKDRGRDDLRMIGDRQRFLTLHGVLFELWHPRSGRAYAKSYGIQKRIETYTTVKPQILLTGHWHMYCHVYTRGVHAIACPTFQGSGSKFSKSLGGDQAQGGLVLRWRVTEHGTIRDFSPGPRLYFEREEPVQLRNPTDAIEIQPQVSAPTVKP